MSTLYSGTILVWASKEKILETSTNLYNGLKNNFNKSLIKRFTLRNKTNGFFDEKIIYLSGLKTKYNISAELFFLLGSDSIMNLNFVKPSNGQPAGYLVAPFNDFKDAILSSNCFSYNSSSDVIGEFVADNFSNPIELIDSSNDFKNIGVLVRNIIDSDNFEEINSALPVDYKFDYKI